MNLLHLDSSIQGAQSASRMLSAAAVERIVAENPAISVIHRDLAAEPVSHLDLSVLGDPAANAELQQFLAADIVVIGAGMYNFGIPSQLKAWIDRILIAGQTFRYGANGPEGLAGAKRVIITLARGGVFSGNSPFAAFEHAETYLRGVLGFIGIKDAQFIVAEGLAMGEESRNAAIETALDSARAPTVAV